MAGIGFELRKLTARDDLISSTRAYLHASIATSGGWLFTIAALSLVGSFGTSVASLEDLTTFRLLVVYNFAFSLVFTGPLTMVLTRYLADQIFARTVTGVPGMVVGGLAVGLAISLPLVTAFDFGYLHLTRSTSTAAVINYALVASVWILSVFLSTLQVYAAVTRAFGFGLVIAVAGAWLAGPDADAGRMLVGFNIGLAYIVFTLVGRIFAEFPFPVEKPLAFLSYFRTKWPLAVGGAVYYLGIWIDKWLMWTGPERVVLPSGLVSCPDYDSALFLACLTTVPTMALFVVHVEVRFFEQVHRFYGEIGGHAPLARIRQNQQALVDVLRTASRQIVLPQLVLVTGLLLVAPLLFRSFDVPYGQLGIFRIAVLGAAFQVFFLLLTIVLAYLDLNRLALGLHCLFFALNTVGTLATLYLGFPFYGYGYFLAAIVTFVAASFATMRSLDELPYHAFITSNASIRS